MYMHTYALLFTYYVLLQLMETEEKLKTQDSLKTLKTKNFESTVSIRTLSTYVRVLHVAT